MRDGRRPTWCRCPGRPWRRGPPVASPRDGRATGRRCRRDPCGLQWVGLEVIIRAGSAADFRASDAQNSNQSECGTAERARTSHLETQRPRDNREDSQDADLTVPGVAADWTGLLGAHQTTEHTTSLPRHGGAEVSGDLERSQVLLLEGSAPSTVSDADAATGALPPAGSAPKRSPAPAPIPEGSVRACSRPPGRPGAVCGRFRLPPLPAPAGVLFFGGFRFWATAIDPPCATRMEGSCLSFC